MTPERILVCGGRNYADELRVFDVLDDCRKWFAASFCIITGGARGADRFAGMWAESRGVCSIRVPAPWTVYGLSAGMLRNSWMLYFCKPELVIAFPGGNGTAGMIKLAREAGVDVYAIR